MTGRNDVEAAVLAVIRQRRSIRTFTDEAVPDDVVQQIVGAARCAPRGGNRPTCTFRALRDPRTLAQMGEIVAGKVAELRCHIQSPRAQAQYDGYSAHFTHFRFAPCVIVVVGRPYDSLYSRIVDKCVPPERVPRQHLVDISAMNTAATVENMLLASEALGYGACFMTGPLVAQAELERFLKVDDPWHVVALVPIGRPASRPPERPAETSDVLSFD
jgi:nitroreductase